MSRNRVLLLVAAAGLAVGAGATGFTIAGILPTTTVSDFGPAAYETPTPAEGVVVGSSGTNENGETYGQWRDSSEPAPDLIEAIATNGWIGYMRATEYFAATAPARSLEEAMNEYGHDDIVIGVYLTDGVTQVGTYTIFGSRSVVIE